MKNPSFVILAALALAGCEAIRPSEVKPSAAAPQRRQTAEAIRTVADTGFREQPRVQPVSLTARGGAEENEDSFEGNDRKAAKISIASAPVQRQSLSRLVAWCEANEDAMQRHDPPISKEANSRRLPEETRNVETDAWVHFAQKETDNDYHVIIGSSADLRDAALLNVEISGLPPTSSRNYAALKQAREQFEDVFAGVMRAGGYTQFIPMHVHIKGSLFYDIDHRPGAVGPRRHAPSTAWEIHPVTEITPLD